MNNQQEVQKSLKRFLKKKIAYTAGILVTFLITGALGLASGRQDLMGGTQEIHEDLLMKITAEKQEIEALLAENETKLSALEKNHMAMVRLGDWYSKPHYQSYFGSFFFNWKDGASKEKDWVSSSRTATEMDGHRKRFNAVISGRGERTGLQRAVDHTDNRGKGSTGWLTKTGNYNNNTHIYDYEDLLMILPVAKSPEVEEPVAPAVSFVVPSAPVVVPVASPQVVNISVGSIAVATPTVAAPNITVVSAVPLPSLTNVDIDEPNFNVSIGSISVTGPGSMIVPSLTTPVISVTLNPQAPPGIVPPSPSTPMPVAPAAPTYTSYVAPGGSWINGHGSGPTFQGYNNFNGNILVAITTAIQSIGGAAPNLASGAMRRQDDVQFPLFSYVHLAGAGGGRGKIWATRTNATTASSGYSNVSSSESIPAYTNEYYAPNNGGIWYPITESAVRPAYTAGTALSNSINGQKNRWLVTVHKRAGDAQTVIERIDFELGGPDGTPNTPIHAGEAARTAEAGVLLMRNDGDLLLRDVTIKLLGRTTVLVDILHYGPHYYSSVALQNVSIDITADDNTIFTTATVSETGIWGTSEYQARQSTWGLPQRDDGIYAPKGISGKIDLGINTKRNTIFYLQPSDSYRWNGYNAGQASMADGSTVSPASHITNPEAFLVYKPLMGRVRYYNRDGSGSKGTFYFNGSGNVGTWIAHYTPDRTKYAYNAGIASNQAPLIDLGVVYMNGDGNVGAYLAQHNTRPHKNGIYMGSLPIDFRIGTSLNGASGTTQIGAGNTDGNPNKTSGNAALYVASGQRTELTTTNGYFPATTNLLTHAATQKYGTGMGAGVQIGYPDLAAAAHAIQPLTVTEYNVTFGKYSLNNYAIIARNGSVVVLNPSQTTITDGQGAGTPDADRADGTIIAFAEGVWYNPRLSAAQRANNDGVVHNGVSVIDGTTGQKYVPQYGSEIRLSKPLALGSKNAVAVFAKDGGKINAQSITVYGSGSTGAFASGNKRWATEALESNTSIGGGTAAPSVINVTGDITLTNGTANRGAIAVSGATGDGARVTVTGKITVNGLGAFAEGVNSRVEIQGAGSVLTSGSDGSLVALNGGVLRFGGGTITHAVEGELPFYSDGAGNSHLTFTAATTVNISRGVVFYGKTTDFAASAGGTTTYNGMSNVTVNLTNNGVNLGVFRDIDVVWDGSATYTTGLATIPKVAAINTGAYWYKSSLDGGKMEIKTNVNRDQISVGATPGDRFNDITMERKQVIIAPGYTITSTAGRGMLLGSNTTANSNTESGYTVRGTIDVSNGANATTAAYVSFGHINVENGGKITVSRGVGAYGVNGSKIENKTGGLIEVDASNAANPGIGILALATNLSGTPDAYGKNAGKTGKWIEISNRGTISIPLTDSDAIGIYADNNRAGALKTDVTIYNEASIILGENGKGIVLKSSAGNGGQITLKNVTGTDIKVGKSGIGVYAEKSNITFDGDYGVEIQEGGIALQAKAGTVITSTGSSDQLTVDYQGAAGSGHTAMGIAYEGVTLADTMQNSLNLKILNTNGAETVTGIYGKGMGAIQNSGNLSVEYTGAYGILTDGVNVVNTGTILVGDNTIPISGAVGIYALNAEVTAAGDQISVRGNGNGGANIYPIGIYAKSSPLLSTGKTIAVNQGTGPMSVSGINAIGIYIEDAAAGKLKLLNQSDLSLNDSASTTDRRLGIFLSGTTAANTTAGTIEVGANNIGIYNKNSTLTNTAAGTINVLHNGVGTENIGIHNIADGGNFSFTNLGSVVINGVKNIGISAATTGADTGLIRLGSGSSISVTATSQANGDIPIGIYAKGNQLTIQSIATNMITVSPNGVGIYLEGDNTTTTTGDYQFDLSSNPTGTTAIGAYYKEGAFAGTGNVNVRSTMTAVDSYSDPIRPIGLYYGENSVKNDTNVTIVSGSTEVIGIYGKELGVFTNNGNIIVNAESIGAYFIDSEVRQAGNITINSGAGNGYGIYFKGGTTEIDAGATVTALASDSIGAIVTESLGVLTNKGTIVSSGSGSIGAYSAAGGKWINDAGATLNATLAGIASPPTAGSIGAFSNHGEIENKGSVTTNYLGLYGKNGAKISQTAGSITVVDGIGILGEGSGTEIHLNGGSITSSTSTGVIGSYGGTDGKITLHGTTTTLGDHGVGIYLDHATGKLIAGDITVGMQGIGIYGKQSTLDFAGYTGILNLGNRGIGIYSEDNLITFSGTSAINIQYSSLSNDKGVGIYYTGTTPVSNALEMNHTGDNLVHIYADGVNVVNTANQTISGKGIGLFVDNGSHSANQGTLILSGDETLGIYLDKTNPLASGTSTLTALGTITGSPVSGVGKVGIYVKDGDITGSQTYHFAIDGGVGLYLVNDVVSYHGKIELAGNSTTTNRSIGVYVSDGITGVLGNDMEITGADAIGIYLATNGVSGANISYHGDLSIVSTGSTLSNRGVGVVLDTGAAFTLGSGGKIEIGGNNNIGFYVKTGATLNVAGGQVSNTVDGVFAYIDDGTIHFSSSTPINIDYANVIVSGSLGVILNDTTIHVGRRGLQGSNGASVTNSALGTMKGSVDEAKALVGTSGATLHNSGSIQLSGEKSVGIYAEGGAVANSSGSVSVGKKSVAYYAGEDVGGVGGTIHVTGTSIAGAGGTIFFANGGDIHYNGANIVVGKEVTVLTLANIGSNVDFFGKTITMGEKGVGVFVTDTGDYQTISNLGSIGVGKEGTGIYLNNAVAFTGNVGMEILGESGIGILTTKNGNITYGGNLTSTASGVKGILSTGTGTLQNNGNIKLIGDSSIGIYGENTAAMINSGTGVVEIGSGNASGKAVAIYGKNAGSVNNAGLVKMQEKAVGIYGKNAVVGNSGTIQSTGKHNTGIYTEGGSVSNTGNIQLKDSSNGIFVKNGAALTNMGNVQVGNTKSAGLYGAGTTPVDHLSGTVTGGKQSVGVASESGALTVAAGANIVMNEESTYIYTESGTGTSGSNLNLSNYSIGMYTKDGTLINNGIITTGQSHVSAASQKISVGMATGTKDGLGNPIGGGAVVNNGTILIPHDYGVGMIANNPTGTASNHGTIGITGENAYGMEGSNGAVITNHGVIKANGRKVRGMAGTGNAIMINETTGKIEVNGLDAVGIYAEHGAQVWNRGEIIIDGGGKVGIHIGQGGILKNTGTITIKNGGMAIQNDGETTVNIGIITIEDGGPKVTVGDIVYDLPTLINGGYIHYVDEALDFGKVKIASTEGNIGTISAASFAKGEFIVLANATQGNNHPVHVVQYLKGAVNLPNSGSVHAISHSVTWLADLQQDPDDPDITRIVLVKIPYAELTAGTKAYEFGKGLDEIYVPAYGTELKMFDAIDMISDKDELGETFDMELRGNVYANIQHRMEDIRESFEMSYEQMSQERLYTKESLKVGAIMGGGKFKDRNPGVEDYEYKSAGFMVVKEYEHRRYGRKSGWSLGFANTEYDFTYGSKEKAYSVNVGVGYEDYVGGSQRLKYHGRVELTSSRHETVRKIHLSNGVYSNKGEFWSYEAIWKNKLRYEIPGMGDGKVRGGVFVGLDVGYGKFDKFGEKGDGIRLEVKGEDLVMVRPGIGGEVTFTQHMRRGKIMVTGVARAEYELGKYYDGANQAKLKETHADYYDLEEPKEMKEILKVGAQVKYETIGGHSVGVEVNREAGSRENSRYGVHFMYRFGK